MATPRPRRAPRLLAPLLAALPAALLGALLGALLLAPAPGGAAPANRTPLTCPEDKELCVEAERSGGIDLATGIAKLEGNVRGVVRSRDLRFRSESLSAHRDGGEEWVRLVLERNVQLTQAGRVSTSDQGVVERELVRLNGRVSIRQEELSIAADEAVMAGGGKRTDLFGTPEAPVRIVLARALVSPPRQPGSEAGEPDNAGTDETTAAPAAVAPAADAGPAGVTTHLRAQQALLEDQPRRMRLVGAVEIEQSDGQLRMQARQVTLHFGADSALSSFEAEGNVVIAQPDRQVAADYAESRNELRTILLVGNATMRQKGTFDVKSDRMEVYADASKGVLQGNQGQQPIKLSLDLAKRAKFGLKQATMLSLSDQGVPPGTLEKLTPLIGQSYGSRAELRQAIAARLSPAEAQRHLDTILAAGG